MRILAIQNCEAEGFGVLESIFESANARFEIFPAERSLPWPALDSIDAVIVGGTPISAYAIDDHPFLVEEERWLRSAIASGTPCVGICFGGQILARILGAEVRRAERKEIGIAEITATDAGATHPLLDGFPPSFPAFQWHGDTFGIPAEAELLATGRECRNQMFGIRRVAGVQFHLEIGSRDAAKWGGVYSAELAEFGKTAEELIREVAPCDAMLEELSRKFVTNFISWASPAR
ncbi:MAG: type 1 glutamine amidotransferase [Thermoanaerobaculia bacterium]